MKHLSYLLSIVCMLSFTLIALASDPPPQELTVLPLVEVEPKQEADRVIMRAYNLASLNLGNGREAANLVIQTAKMVLPDVRFMVDIPNNMLIVHGSNADHEKLLDVLHQLQNPQALPERASVSPSALVELPEAPGAVRMQLQGLLQQLHAEDIRDFEEAVRQMRARLQRLPAEERQGMEFQMERELLAVLQRIVADRAQERSGVSPPPVVFTPQNRQANAVPLFVEDVMPTRAFAAVSCPLSELHAQRERAYVTIARQYFQIVNMHATLVRERMFRQRHHPRSPGDHEMNDDGLKEEAAVAVERFENTFKKISPMMQTELVIELAGTTFCVEALIVLETLLDDICMPMPERPRTSFTVEHGQPHVIFVPQRAIPYVGPLPATLCDDDEICCPPPTAPVREYRITPPAPVSAPRSVNY